MVNFPPKALEFSLQSIKIMMLGNSVSTGSKMNASVKLR